MGRARLRRPGQGPSDSADTGQCLRTFRPRLELLEERVQLGDTILGLSAVALWGLDFSSLDVPLALDSSGDHVRWDGGLFSSPDAVASLSLADSRNYVAKSAASADHAVTAK